MDVRSQTKTTGQPPQTKNENIHSGHRQRLRQKYLRLGVDALEPHELLELLLFYAVPRANTNPIAHRLLKRFGSLKNVLKAPPEELVKVEGIGENSALLFSLVFRIACRALTDDMQAGSTFIETDDVIMNTTRELMDYFLVLMAPERQEVLYQLCLDAKGKVLERFKISEGCSAGVDFDVRQIVVNALSSNASMAVLAHNHPSGLALPSEADMSSTEDVRLALEAIHVTLADHIIVADGDAISFRQSGFLR